MLTADMLRLIDWALQEDLGTGDCTSMSSVPEGMLHEGFVLAKEDGVVAGIDVAREVFRLVDDSVQFEALKRDGEALVPGDVVIRVKGPARSILSAERLALNFLQRMSGVATMTRRAAEALRGTPTRVLDTRKTTPGLRAFEKWAVQLGGGVNHRMGLYDMILIKDNHVDYAGSMTAALRGVQSYFERGNPRVTVVVEVRSMSELEEAMTASSDLGLALERLLLDNFTPNQVREAVRWVDGRLPLEASGGIDLSNLRLFGEAGGDFVSMGALTHSVKSLDLSLKSQPTLRP
ncbi:MAG: carboxylating nicotinate-nucleotide diphosphorylase [Bacteroidetes bacterium]|nr:carboxylating nicotinate-nucleotide diphosphorylase [Bacteroidota bacterium]